MSDEEREPTITVSMSRKIQVRQYETADVFVSVQGVRAGMTAEQLAPLLETGKVAWDAVRAALVEQLHIAQRSKGWETSD